MIHSSSNKHVLDFKPEYIHVLVLGFLHYKHPPVCIKFTFVMQTALVIVFLFLFFSKMA